MNEDSMEEKNMAEFRLYVCSSPWHATLERLPRNIPLEHGQRIQAEILEFLSPLELVSYLERGETREAPPRGLR